MFYRFSNDLYIRNCVIHESLITVLCYAQCLIIIILLSLNIIKPLKRIYLPTQLKNGASVPVPEVTFHHLFRVMRCRSGDSFVAFNGDGNDYTGRLVQITKKTAEFSVTGVIKNERESPLRIILLQGLSKGDRMDTAIQKAVELGVNEIYPVTCEYSSVKFDEKRLIKKQQHWQSIIISACEQSERAIVPKLHSLKPLEQIVQRLESSCKIVLHPYQNITVKPLPSTVNQAAVLIGPEGGLSDKELSLLEENHFQRLALGQRILRTETATVSALSVMQLLWGDWHV